MTTPTDDLHARLGAVLDEDGPRVTLAYAALAEWSPTAFEEIVAPALLMRAEER